MGPFLAVYSIIFPGFLPGFNLVSCSVMDPNTLNLDPNPGFWHNLDPDPGPDPGEIKLNNFREEHFSFKKYVLF